MAVLKDNLVGSQLANYVVKKQIGKGGMGDVYLGIDIKLKRPVAIKVVDTRFMANQTFAQRFVEEAQRIATWRHENIVQVFYADNTDYLYYYVMEYIGGSDLSHVIASYATKQELMPIDEILRVGREVASALDYAHAKGSVHRDVKPANIMISNEGRAILADFGLAHDMNKSTLGGVLGTPVYISPEQAMAPSDAVPQSDLYSLAVILYELLTGYTPFQYDTPLELMKAHVGETPISASTINTNLGANVDAILHRALSKNPTHRYETGEALMDALDAMLSNVQWSQDGESYETIIYPPNSETSETRTTTILTVGELVKQNPSHVAYSLAEDGDLTIEFPTENSSVDTDLAYYEKPKRHDKEKKKRAPVPMMGIMMGALLGLLALGLVMTAGGDGNNTLVTDANVTNDMSAASLVSSYSGEFSLEFVIDGKHSIQVSNVSNSQMPLGLTDLRIADARVEVSGAEWAVEELAYGECAVALKNTNRLARMADDDCSRIGPALTYNQNRWNEDVNIYYAGEFIGTCAGEVDDDDQGEEDDEHEIRTCVLTFEV